MQLTLETSGATYRISAYGEGFVVVNGERIERSLVVLPDALLRDWPPTHFDEVALEHMAEIAAHQPEIILLGTGAEQQFPSTALMRPFLEANIGVEFMNTAAACRTFNILTGEARRVAAALIV